MGDLKGSTLVVGLGYLGLVSRVMVLRHLLLLVRISTVLYQSILPGIVRVEIDACCA